MTLGERMLNYRARHNLTQIEMAELMGENSNTIYKCESGKVKLHKVNEVRVNIKLKELEDKENV